MFLGKHNLSNDWARLGDLISIDNLKTYTIQNIGYNSLIIQENSILPDVNVGFVVVPHEVIRFVPEGYDLYLRGSTTIVIEEYQ
jgi:hypothetical protein